MVSVPVADAVERPRKPRVWHLFALFLIAQAIILVASGVAIGVVAARRGLVGPDMAPEAMNELIRRLVRSPEVTTITFVAGIAVCLGLALLVGWRSPRSFAGRLRVGRGHLSVAELAVAALGLLAFGNGFDGLARLLPGYEHSAQAFFAELFQNRSSGSLALLVAVVAAGAPLAEELFYRGALQTRFAERFGARWGLIIASLCFGLAHFEPFHVIYAFGAGLFLGWISDLAGSIRASLLVHAVNNVLAALGAVWASSVEGVLVSAPATAVSLALAAACIAWLWRRRRARPNAPLAEEVCSAAAGM